ncbi:TadE family protein [Pseudoduganella violaceinigra]|uniref:TadE family protein n=1 Tax=Pseudoduganella violaceinigra TaxID=246602 RepID=UPI0003F8D2B3|nr:TadE family protein [Pseudoduganella violaceinigra]
MTVRASRRRGLASVEFAIVCLVVMPFLFATIEYGRLVFLWNAVPEVTRRAARAAAAADFSNPAALQALRRAALFRSDDGPLPLAPNVGSANLRIEYLWQDAAGALAPLPLLPACPLANRVNCARDPHGAACISFVRVRLCGSGAGCPALAYEALLPMVPVPDALPAASALVAAESLGYAPGQAPCP